MRAAIYTRVSTDGQAPENQAQALLTVADRRRWSVVKTYTDQGIGGAKDPRQRPAFDAMLRDASRRRFDVLMVWAIDRIGRRTATVATALADLNAAGVAIYADREGMDATTAHGRAMLQMAAVFAELEHAMIRERVNAGIARARKAGKRLGRPPVSAEIEAAVRIRRADGKGLLAIARELGIGSSTVQRITAT